MELGAAPPVVRSGGPQTQPTRYLDSKNPTLRVWGWWDMGMSLNMSLAFGRRMSKAILAPRLLLL